MSLTASKLRANVYRILDQVLDTGNPIEIVRRGRKLKIVPVEEEPSSWLDNLVERPDVIPGDPEDLANFDWSKALRSWREAR